MNLPRSLSLLAVATTMTTALHAQPLPRSMTPGDITLAVRRLNVVGSVLYVAAHPDDENTRLLTWMVGSRGLRAGYLSLTRGDGGQNLVGTEQDDLLGLLRTHELLAARRIDGAEQMFTRMKDFGYSKSAAETLRIWGREDALQDVVLAIRRFQPDIIITRFSTLPPNHGHHTASALLAEEAFTAAADATRFVGVGTPWKAHRLVHNVSTWSLPPNADMSAYLKVDVGTYEPLLGRSWGELAAESRTQHKSQGFGVAPERGPLLEYFAPVAGPVPQQDVWDGVDSSWKRFAGTEKLVAALDVLTRNHDLRAPQKSVPHLLAVRDALLALPDTNPWKVRKLKETDRLLLSCTGLFLETRASEATVPPGGTANLTHLAINRSAVPVSVVGITAGQTEATFPNGALVEHVPFKGTSSMTVRADQDITTPYWLRLPAQGAHHNVADLELVGLPQQESALVTQWTLDVAGKRLTVTVPVMHAWTDPVRGELYRPLEVAPAVTATLDRDVVMVPNGAAQTVNVTVEAGQREVEATVRLEVPDGWKAEPASTVVRLSAWGETQTVPFTIKPPKGTNDRVTFKVLTDHAGRTQSWRSRTVRHDHVPPLTVRQVSQGTLVPFTFVPKVKRIGYIPGPGDRVAESLAAVGYDVTVIPEERLAREPLEKYDALVIGVRAFNANPKLAAHRERLNQYVQRGGRVVAQYNTNSRIGPLTVPMGPFPLDVGRDRVTDETATMTPLNAADPVLNTPNKITAADQEGWVQERGLYFAAKWDPAYRPVFQMQDPDEAPSQGALLVARHGKGVFIYTGLAFFRQLPAGVPGAYRLFANLLAQ